MESFSSSYHHNKSLNGAPLGRIVMTGPKIMYRNREYTSASEALVDYINEFEGNRRKFKSSNSCENAKDVRDLLSTRFTQRRDRTDLSEQAFRTSEGPIDLSRLSLRELRLSTRPTRNGGNDTLQFSTASIEESYRRMMQVDDAMEVAHTLNQSYDVLKKVEEDRLSNVGEVPSRSDLQSLATESLISVDPYPVNNEEIPGPQLPELRRGHVFSYRTPRSRTHTVTGVTFSSRTNGMIANSKGPLNSEAVNGEFGKMYNKPVLGGSLPDARQGRQPSGNKSNFTSTPRYRSRSVSPSFDTGKFYPDSYPRGRRAPSWLEDLDTSRESRQSNAANFRGLHTRKTPSWIEDIMGSTTTSSVAETENVNRIPETSTVSSSSIISDSKTSSSNLDAVLRASDLDIAADFISGRSEKQRSNSAYVHTSTPLKKHSVRTETAKYGVVTLNGLPDRFRLSDTCNIDGKTVSSISTSDSRLSRNIESNTDLHIDCAENNDKIGKMLKELDVIKTKLKSSSDDTHNCIRELTSAQGGDKPRPEEPSHVRHLSGEDNPAASPRRQSNTQGRCTSSSANPDLRVTSSTSVVTDDILQGDSLWERHPGLLREDGERDHGEDKEVYGIKNPGVIGDFLNDCLNTHNKEPAQKQSHDTLSGGSQPGSMEALKNMLFKLQSEASVNQENKNEERDMALQGRGLQTDEEDEGVDPVRVLEDNDFNSGPGAQSLEKALVHLSRLKTLVQGSAFNPDSRIKSTPNASSSSS